MSCRISKELNSAIKEYKSCFGCTFFKIKPFKTTEKLSETKIDFKITSEKVRCTKEMFPKLDLKSCSNVRTSKNTKTNRNMILRDSLKCIDRYKNIASVCSEYDGED